MGGVSGGSHDRIIVAGKKADPDAVSVSVVHSG